jgi:lipid II:glycine glycyltransferase (peptidoglycan interpeptide bridge formation enzyme)
MNIRIEYLDEFSEASYERLLLSVKTTLIYSSLNYRNFLQRILEDSKSHYLLAYDGEELVGALPAFVKFNNSYGNILNSLPFYGSNGSPIISPRCHNPNDVKETLLRAFHELGLHYQVVTSTLITNPLEQHNPDEGVLNSTWKDVRIGQFTQLPSEWYDEDDLQSHLMKSFHKKTRNSIRKAEKNNVIVAHSSSLETLKKMAAMHQENVESIGGLAKPWPVFAAINKTFTYDQNYRVYTAERNGELIAALLVFFYNQTAEYFTPTTLEGARFYQPMSLLIFEAMKEAAKRGYLYWNWGGTWITQSGVYKFKSRWGTQDRRYYYYIQEYNKDNPLRELTAQEIQTEFPYFYVLPFKTLRSEKNKSGQ